MGVGDGALLGYASYVGLARETAWGTKKTSTTYLEFISESMEKKQDSEMLNSINTSRNPTHRVLKDEVCAGAVESYLNVASDAVTSLFIQAMGGSCTTVGTSTSGCVHTIVQGTMSNTTQSVTLQIKKGNISPLRLHDYVGCRVNKFTIKAAPGEQCTVSFDLIGKYGTTSSDSLTCALIETNPLNWAGVTYKVGAQASMTSVLASGTSEAIAGLEITYENGLISDAQARNLGSTQLGVLPAGSVKTSMKITQRYDTSTAEDRAFAETALSAGVVFNSTKTIGGAAGSTTYSMAITYPKCFVSTMQPKVNGAGILMLEYTLEPVAPSAGADIITMSIVNGTEQYA